MLHCGLLGEKLGHSYSPRIHRMLGDYEYLLFEKSPEELPEFIRNGNWDGLNVTIPYKKTVMEFCSELSPTAARIGSVNTLVRRADGCIYGDNTDAFGFASLMRKNQIDPKGKKTLVLGNGGAAASVCAVLDQAGAQVITISRKGSNHYSNLYLHKDAKLIVNTTPVGMFPGNGASPVDLRQFPECTAVLDIIYNPARTALTLQAEELGIACDTGLYMLTAQAVRSSELFTGNTIPASRIDEITSQLSLQMQNIVLIGMPGCGKTSVARYLGAMTGRKVLDLDEEFTRRYGMTPEICIRNDTEACFREKETEVIREAGKQSGMVLSTGGGCVTVPQNYPLLHQNSTIVWIRREIKELPVDGRPLSQAGSLQKLYEVRKPMYERFADFSVENQRTAEETAAEIYDFIMRS